MYLVLERYEEYEWTPPYNHYDPQNGTSSKVARIRAHQFESEPKLKGFLSERVKDIGNFDVYEAKPLKVKTSVEISINLL